MSFVQLSEDRDPECVGLVEAGQLLGVCPRTVRREIDRRRLAAFRAGRLWKIRKGELCRYMQSVSVGGKDV